MMTSLIDFRGKKLKVHKETTKISEHLESAKDETSVRFHFAVTPEIWSKLTEQWSSGRIKPDVSRYREFILDTSSCELIKENCWYIQRFSSLEKCLKVDTLAGSDGYLLWKSIRDTEKIDKYVQSKLHGENAMLSPQMEWQNTRIMIDEGMWVDIVEWNNNKYRQYAVGTIDILKASALIGDIMCEEEVIPAPSKALAVAADKGGILWDSCKSQFAEEFITTFPLLLENCFPDFCNGKTTATEAELLDCWGEKLDANLVPVQVNENINWDE